MKKMGWKQLRVEIISYKIKKAASFLEAAGFAFQASFD